MYNIRVCRPYRGQAIASAIGDEVLAWLAGRGVQRAYALIRESNAASLGLFQKLEFAVQERMVIRRLGRSVRIQSTPSVEGRLEGAGASASPQRAQWDIRDGHPSFSGHIG